MARKSPAFKKERIDKGVSSTVKIINAKPHVRYIRYLMTKRYSPIAIKQELFRLGLSAPHEPSLTAYYLAVIDPLVKHFKLGELYSDYKNKILRTDNQRTSFSKEILNYSITMGKNLDMQVEFCKFIKELEVDSLWLPELQKFHGSVVNMPTDEAGNRIISARASAKSVEKILVHPKRYLIDKMLLENMSDERICEYCKSNLKIQMQRYDVAFYRQVFFNIKTHSIEDKITTLENEKGCLENLLRDIDKLADYQDMGVGEKSVIKRQAEQRISELDDNIRMLNMIFTEMAFKGASAEKQDFEQMFTDIISRGYKRFCDLDIYKDRDVIDPMFKVARIMTFAHDKVENMKNSKTVMGDKHSQTVLLELYKKRTDDIMNEEAKRVNKELEEAGIEPFEDKLQLDEIHGIEDLGASFEIEDEEEEEKK